MTTTNLPVRAPGELILLHRRALHATGGVVDRAVLYATDDPEVGRLIRSATLANLWTAEYLGRWSLPAAAGEAGADAYHRSVDLVDEAACRPGALRANAPLSDGSVGDGAALLVERIVALDRVGRALATAASVHRTVDAELDLLVAQVVARSGLLVAA